MVAVKGSSLTADTAMSGSATVNSEETEMLDFNVIGAGNYAV